MVALTGAGQGGRLPPERRLRGSRLHDPASWAAPLADPGSPDPRRPDWAAPTGKTQLAIYYAESQWRARAIDLLAWIDASSRAAILCGYADAVAATTGSVPSGDPELVAGSFLSWLEQTSQRWLIVLDDLASGDDIDGLWPAGAFGRVVITTRNPGAVTGRALCLEIGPFSRRDAMSYLVGRLSADPEQRRGAIDLIEDLDFQPLALTQASAVIANSWTTCADYREYFGSRQNQLADLADSAAGRPAAAAVTWVIAVEQAELMLPGGAVQNCLAFAAVLDGHGIPIDVFTTNAGSDLIAASGFARGGPEELARNALSALERVCLVTIDKAGVPRAARLNHEVQAAVRSVLPSGGLQRVADAAAAALLEAWPQGDQRSRPAQMFRASAAELRRCTGEVLWANGSPALLIRVGQSLDSAQMVSPAVEYWRDLVADGQRYLGPGHPDSLRLVEHLASACQTAGLAEDSVLWLRRIVDDRIRALGAHHPLSLAALVSLGRTMAAVGDFGNALAVLDSTLAESQHARGVAHPDTLSIRDDVASVYLAAGQPDQAILLGSRTLAERERSQGPAHRDTLATRNALAEAYLADGRIKNALSQYRRAYEDRVQSVGPAHRDTLRAGGALAAAYHLAGRMPKAVQLYEETRAGCERTLGANDPDSLAACLNLARGYYAVGRLSNAADLLRDTIARCEQVLPSTDPLVRSARETLAAIAGN